MPHDHWSDMAKYVYHVDKNNVHYLTEERPMANIDKRGTEEYEAKDQTDAFEDVENKETIGKYMAGVIEDFLPALEEVAKMQAKNIKPIGKYERSSWMTCPKIVYKDAFWRHLLAGPETVDPATGFPHDVAIAWNALALVWFRLQEDAEFKEELAEPYSLRDQKKWESE